MNVPFFRIVSLTHNHTDTSSRSSCKVTCTKSSCRPNACRPITSRSSSTKSSEVRKRILWILKKHFWRATWLCYYDWRDCCRNYKNIAKTFFVLCVSVKSKTDRQLYWEIYMFTRLILGVSILSPTSELFSTVEPILFLWSWKCSFVRLKKKDFFKLTTSERIVWIIYSSRRHVVASSFHSGFGEWRRGSWELRCQRWFRFKWRYISQQEGFHIVKRNVGCVQYTAHIYVVELTTTVLQNIPTYKTLHNEKCLLLPSLKLKDVSIK